MTTARPSTAVPIARSVKLALWALTVVLVLFPLSAARPGQPPTMKADEPAYFLAGLSLILDGDLRCDQHDVQRAFDHYQYFPIDNLILMTPDGWNTVYFGKPYIYSALAAPWAALAGPRGYVVFNMVLLAAMIWMGALYLRRFNPDSTAALYSSLFFLLSAGFVYAFWIHPEVLNMCSIAACLFFAFHEPGDRAPAASPRSRLLSLITDQRMWPVWSAAALAPAVYNKPMLALLGVPALVRVLRRRGWKGALLWTGGAILAMGLIAGVSIALTGQPSAYLGVARGGVNAERPIDFAKGIETARKNIEARSDANPNSWQWIFHLPDVHPRRLLGDLRYFLVGRHTGLLPYFPFALLSTLLFFLHGRRSRLRWLLAACLVGVALSFLLWIPFNWHGGGGFVGNRYYVNAYPAFLFLVTAVRPAFLSVLTAGLAALSVGSLVFAPWGLAVPKGSLQAHTRGGIYGLLQPELAFHNRISGYEAFGVEDVGAFVREDLTKILSKEDGIFRVRGAVTSEIWVFGKEPLEQVYFEVASPLPENEVVLRHAGREQVVSFDGSDADRRVIVKVPLRDATRVWGVHGDDEFFYKLLVTPRHGLHEGGNMRDVTRNPIFYAGARLRLLGSQAPEPGAPDYAVQWHSCEVPDQVATGGRLSVPIHVSNVGDRSWNADGRREVRFTYKWLNADGIAVEAPNFRQTRLRGKVERGEEYRTSMVFYAPRQAGTYRLVLEAMRKPVGRFPPRQGGSCETRVEVEDETR